MLAAVGCGEPPEVAAPQAAPTIEAAPETANATEETEATAAATEQMLADADSVEETSSDETPLTPTPTEGKAPQPTVAQYAPPFPDRVELFMPPKREGGVRTEGESQDAVELLGFIRLDRQQVVLSINGQVTPIHEGASELGVEVISIQPPKVVLQRGRQRWQASLEN